MPIDLGSNAEHKPGLVIYLTAGDPDLDTTLKLALAAIDAGADVIELGVPFSDPVADGPVIQRASERSLARGTRLKDVLSLAAQLRAQRPAAGIILFSYLNPILRLGLEQFCREAAATGADGVLVIDLIVEEAAEYLALMRRFGLKPVFLAAPTSPDDRLRKIASVSEGFVYAISRAGITGTQRELAKDARALVERIRRHTSLPIAVGFGVSGPEHVAEVGAFADAAVIGSAIVALVEQSEPRAAPAAIAKFIRGLRPPVPVAS